MGEKFPLVKKRIITPSRLPHDPNKFNLDSVLSYYKIFLTIENQKLTFLPTSEEEVLKLLKDTSPEKAAGIENLSRMFLKDLAVVLALPILKVYNLSMRHSKFPLARKISKLKPLYKKESKTDSKTIASFRFCHLFQNFQRKLFIIKLKIF